MDALVPTFTLNCPLPVPENPVTVSQLRLFCTVQGVLPVTLTTALPPEEGKLRVPVLAESTSAAPD